MIQIQQTLLSDEIFEEQFICDLCKCKGQCCVEGESGAPLTAQEFREIEEILPQIWDDLSPKAQEVVNAQGIAYTDYDGELVTSLVNGQECVFTYFDADGNSAALTGKATATKHTRKGVFLYPNPYRAIFIPSG